MAFDPDGGGRSDLFRRMEKTVSEQHPAITRCEMAIEIPRLKKKKAVFALAVEIAPEYTGQYLKTRTWRSTQYFLNSQILLEVREILVKAGFRRCDLPNRLFAYMLLGTRKDVWTRKIPRATKRHVSRVATNTKIVGRLVSRPRNFWEFEGTVIAWRYYQNTKRRIGIEHRLPNGKKQTCEVRVARDVGFPHLGDQVICRGRFEGDYMWLEGFRVVDPGKDALPERQAAEAIQRVAEILDASP